eukprot:2636964-Alexandrium_andersonii.AAC.1
MATAPALAMVRCLGFDGALVWLLGDSAVDASLQGASEANFCWILVRPARLPPAAARGAALVGCGSDGRFFVASFKPLAYTKAVL